MGQPSRLDPDSSLTSRRARTDPSTLEEARRQLVHNLLDGKVSKTAVNLVAGGRDALGRRPQARVIGVGAAGVALAGAAWVVRRRARQ